jgi:hypothetical protein
MRFHVHSDPIRQRVLVYCEVGEQDGRRIFQTREPQNVVVALGEEPPLWDWFPLEVVTELAEALSPRPAASERHLDDAIAVRDRLLAMVERAAYPPQIITGPGA